MELNGKMIMTTSAVTTKTTAVKIHISFLDYERADSKFRWPMTEKGQHANKITMAIYGTHTKQAHLNKIALNTFTAIVNLSRFNNSCLKSRQRRP